MGERTNREEAMTLSYAHGASTVPLIGETIGANLERTAARVKELRGEKKSVPQ